MSPGEKAYLGWWAASGKDAHLASWKDETEDTRTQWEAAAVSVAIDAIGIAVRFGGIDGDHHKAWVIDQMVRALAGNAYDQVVREACDGENGPHTYEWNEGIPP